MLSHSDLLKLKRWNTPTVYNGWEQITNHDTTKGHFNLDETRDYMPQMGPMVGYAVTVVCEPSNPKHLRENPDNLRAYREYLASVPGPKIVVVQDRRVWAGREGEIWAEGRVVGLTYFKRKRVESQAVAAHHPFVLRGIWITATQ